jgi:hypothetical protein
MLRIPSKQPIWNFILMLRRVRQHPSFPGVSWRRTLADPASVPISAIACTQTAGKPFAFPINLKFEYHADKPPEMCYK